MEVPETLLKPPQQFPFPFTPYTIQEDLMRNLYEALEGKKLGIFESPTGTGKSMSLICGSLKWLLDAENRKKQDLNHNIQQLEKELRTTNSSTNWLDNHAEQSKIKQKKDIYMNYLKKISDKEFKIEDIKEKARKLKENSNALQNSIRKKKVFPVKETNYNKENAAENLDEAIDDDDILLEDVPVIEKNEEQSSDSEPDTEKEKEDEYNSVKIYLCSRTHSQLAQLVGEIKKSPFNDLNIRVASLASRQNYCINEAVLKLKHLSLINERCQDLHKKKKGKTTKNSEKGEKLKKQKISSGCPFYQQQNIDNLKALSLTTIQDVEDLVELGKSTSACPYYASRYSVEDAQVIIVPYNTILHKNTRLACGINLENSIVIIDEAHNLLDTISSIHSCIVTGHQLACAHSQLTQYKNRYHGKFSAFNLLHLNQLIFIINKLLVKIGGKPNINPKTASMKQSSTILETLVEFIFSCEIDTINLFKVLEFSNKSKIVHKLKGYVEKYKPTVVVHERKEEKGVSAFLKNLSKKDSDQEKTEKDQVPDTEDQLTGNPLIAVLSFIESLTNHCVDGRIVTTVGTTIGNSSLKFLLLNPAAHFADIVKQARSVILAGGTMQPMSEFTDQLFYLAGGERDRIFTFSCGHIIPPTSILPIIVSSGPSGRMFDFSYQNRTDPALLDELGRLLVNVCNVTPAGAVCFFPSYEYEQTVFHHFIKTNVIEKLERKKKVLREPKKSNEVEQTLRLYSKSVEEKGAVLFSVVGGKLSEGLNFSDDLGRCVIVVGLPYPNLTSPELKEKMNYLNTSVDPGAGRIYYENLCMKAVNQSIGRSVRHKNDYASVLLIDHRYSRSQCKNALPEWIQKSLKVETKFGPIMESLAKFFAAKRKKN